MRIMIRIILILPHNDMINIIKQYRDYPGSLSIHLAKLSLIKIVCIEMLGVIDGCGFMILMNLLSHTKMVWKVSL